MSLGRFELPDYGYDAKSLFADAAKRAADVRMLAIESAITGWAARAGVTVEEWLKSYGYTVETKWEGLTVRFVVKPVAAYPGQEVVFPQLVDDAIR